MRECLRAAQSEAGTASAPEAAALLQVQARVGTPQLAPLRSAPRVQVLPQHGSSLSQDVPSCMLPPGLRILVGCHLQPLCCLKDMRDSATPACADSMLAWLTCILWAAIGGSLLLCIGWQTE